MMRIKICGLRNRENILELVPLQPGFMGFIFYPHSPRYVGDDPDPELFSSVPEGIVKIGVFVNSHIDHIRQLAVRFGLGGIQLHGEETSETAKELKKEGLLVIKAIGVAEIIDASVISEQSRTCDFVLLDTKTKGHGGSGKKFNWDLIRAVPTHVQFMLSGGIGPSDSQAIRGIRHPGLTGVDINSGFETEPGLKDAHLVKLFINDLKSAEK